MPERRRREQTGKTMPSDPTTSSRPAPSGFTVGVAATEVGVTIRTLHHWDARGIVRPSGRSEGGYRLYSPTDIARLRRVLTYRELGLPLDRISALLDASSFGTRDDLLTQRTQLVERMQHLGSTLDAIDRMLDASESGILLSPDEQVQIFGEHWNPRWVDGARARWGTSPQWTEYTENSAGKTAADWVAFADDTAALTADLASALRAGQEPGGVAGNTLAERHRESVSRHFHCTHSMHVCIGRRYLEETGFANHYDAIEPGLTAWLVAVIDANARAHGIDPATATWE